MSDIRFSIIIPVNRRTYIKRCVDSIEQSKSNVNEKLEVVLVGEDVNDIIKDKDYVKIIPVKETHTSKRRNTGVYHSKGEVLIFIDDDTRLPVDYLLNVVRLLRTGKEVLTGPTIPYYGNERELITDILVSDYIGELRTAEKARKNTTTDFYNVYLCNVVMRRETYLKIGQFNESIDYRMDDTEYFYRAQKKGVRLFYSGELRLYHKRRPFSQEFLRHTFISRFYTGINTVRHFNIMYNIPGIKLILSLLVIFTFVFLYFPLTALLFLFTSSAMVYTLFIYWISLKKKEIKKNMIKLPPVIFLNHLHVFFGFICGLLIGIINQRVQ